MSRTFFWPFYTNNLYFSSLCQKNLTRLKFRSLRGATHYSIAHKMDIYRDLSCLRSLTSIFILPVNNLFFIFETYLNKFNHFLDLVSLDLDLKDDTLLLDCELVSPSVKYLRLSLSTMSKSCGGKVSWIPKLFIEDNSSESH